MICTKCDAFNDYKNEACCECGHTDFKDLAYSFKNIKEYFVDIPKIPDDALRYLISGYLYSIGSHDKSETQFKRKAVQYLRHEFSIIYDGSVRKSYDGICDGLKMSAEESEDAYMLLVDMLHDEIKRQYPHFAEECDRQRDEKLYDAKLRSVDLSKSARHLALALKKNNGIEFSTSESRSFNG